MVSAPVSPAAEPHPSPPAPAAHPRGRAYALALLCMAYALSFFDRNILNILMDPIRTSLHVSNTAMGFLSGFGFLILYCTLGLPLARWADRSNRRVLLALCLIVWSTMTCLAGAATSFLMLLATRVGVGVGEAGGTPLSHSLITDFYSRRDRPRAMAIFQSAVYVGALLGYLVGGWVSQLASWRLAFVVAGLPGFPLAILVFLGLKDPGRGATEPEADLAPVPLRRVLGELFSQPALPLIILAFAVLTIPPYAFGAWIPTFLRRVHHMSNGEIGSWLSLVTGVSGLVGVLLGGVITHRLPAEERWTMYLVFATCILVPLALAVAVFTPSKPVFFVSYAIANLLMGLPLGPIFALILSRVKVKMRALTSSITNLANNVVAMGLGPLMVGVEADVLKPAHGIEAIRYAFVVPLFTPLLALALFAWAGRLMGLRLYGGASSAPRTPRHATAARSSRPPDIEPIVASRATDRGDLR